MNKSYLGDCLQIMKLFDDGYFNMMFADLPYSMTKNDWDKYINLYEFFKQAFRITNGPIVMTAAQPFTSLLVSQSPGGFRHHWIWEKSNATGHLNANRAPMRCHEDILVFGFGAILYNPQKTTGHKRKVSSAEHKRNSKKSDNYSNYGNTGYDSTERFPRSVVRFKSDKQKSKLHATQKPVALIEYLIKTYSNEGDRIIDPTAGSFTTAIACENTGREWCCIEKDAEIYKIGNDRVSKHLQECSVKHPIE